MRRHFIRADAFASKTADHAAKRSSIGDPSLIEDESRCGSAHHRLPYCEPAFCDI
jgi:hypothetical protein